MTVLFRRKGTCTKIEALRQSLQNMFLYLDTCPLALKIGLSYGKGTDLAGGNWNEISHMFNEITEQHERDIYLYKVCKIVSHLIKLRIIL